MTLRYKVGDRVWVKNPPQLQAKPPHHPRVPVPGYELYIPRWGTVIETFPFVKLFDEWDYDVHLDDDPGSHYWHFYAEDLIDPFIECCEEALCDSE